jgi:hypothetical protein
MYLSICSLIPALSHPRKKKKRWDMGLLELSGTEKVGVIATDINVYYRRMFAFAFAFMPIL